MFGSAGYSCQVGAEAPAGCDCHRCTFNHKILKCVPEQWQPWQVLPLHYQACHLHKYRTMVYQLQNCHKQGRA